MQVSLSALAACSRIVQSAFSTQNKKNNRAAIDNVILPKGNTYAYVGLVKWINKCVASGRLVHFRDIKRTPIKNYLELISIADMLSINYLAVGLRSRIARMLARGTSSDFTLDAADIRYAFTQVSVDEEIRAGLADAAAPAVNYNTLNPRFVPNLQSLHTELPIFADMVAYRIGTGRVG